MFRGLTPGSFLRRLFQSHWADDDLLCLEFHRRTEGRIFRFGVLCNLDLQHVARLKAARALLGWSQDDLALNTGVSVPTVKRLEAADGDTWLRRNRRGASTCAYDRSATDGPERVNETARRFTPGGFHCIFFN